MKSQHARVGLFIPTLNAARYLRDLLAAIEAQSRVPDRLLIIDSDSDDGTAELARDLGAEVAVIPRNSFDHGGTRQMALETLSDVDITIFMTQDAIPAKAHSLERLLDVFGDPCVGVAYGRQLPHPGAGPLSALTRHINYPAVSSRQSMADIKAQGIRATFCSNAFAAYRRQAAMGVGGFPRTVIWGEDALLAARLMEAGWTKAYVADSLVHHSHDYNIREHFQLSFDAGVCHADNPWFLALVGTAENEGSRFARRLLGQLAREAPGAIPGALLVLAARLAGYRLGRQARHLPGWVRTRAACNKAYLRRPLLEPAARS